MIWKEPYDVSWAIAEDLLCIRCRYHGETYFLPPLGTKYDNFPALFRRLQDLCVKNGTSLRFRSVPLPMLNPILKAVNHNARVIEDRAFWDYVYLTNDLLELKGRKYQHQRQALRKFRQTYGYQYTSLDVTDAPAMNEVFDAWAAAHPDSETVTEERTALLEALHQQNTLQWKAGGLRIGKELVAFAIGSMLSPESALIHFEKARPEYHGVYAAINWEFISNVWNQTKTINREDDLGLPNLREAKSRYHPIRMVVKYTVEIL